MTRALLLLLLVAVAEAFVALPRRALRPAGLALRGEAEDAAAMLAEAAKLRAEIEEAEGSMSEANAILEKAYAEKKAAAAYVNPRGDEPEKKKAAAAPAAERKPAADAALAKALAGIGSNQDAFVKTLASLKALTSRRTNERNQLKHILKKLKDDAAPVIGEITLNRRVRITKTVRAINKQLRILKKEFALVTLAAEEAAAAFIQINRQIYPQVVINLNNDLYIEKEERSSTKITQKNGNLHIT